MKMKIIIQLLIISMFLACGPRSKIHPSEKNNTSKTENKPHSKFSKGCKIAFRKANGVLYIPVRINGVDMEAIFDTGASDIVISSIEALFMKKQGKLLEEDIQGEAYYQIADGSIAVGTVINLRNVQIGSVMIENVQATVVNNIEAPLLFGQSALENFGRVNIDYKNQVIEFY